MKQQKKLLVIFFITIFLPSVSLSIFGIIALRNEKFRLEKQIENEQLQVANSIKERIETKFTEIEERLENLASYPSFRQKDYPVIKELIASLFEKDSLAGIIFLLYRNEEPLFPLFQTGFEEDGNNPVATYDIFLQQQIKNAQDAEYIRNDYDMAVSIYNDAFLQSKNKTIKARILNHIARNLMKAGKFSEAAEAYTKIINNYPDEKTKSGLPLELHAKLQKTECYSMTGDKASAVEDDLTVFEELILNRCNLNESQFKAYSSIVIERLTGLLSDSGTSMEYKTQFELLKKRYQYKTEQWEAIGNIKSYIVPELPAYLQTNSNAPSPFEFLKRIGNEDYLVLAVMIPGQNQPENAGILGAKLNSLYLQNNILNNAIEEIQPPQNTVLYITTLSGDSIKGDKSNIPGTITTTTLFNNNFPPWRLELEYIGPKGLGEINIFANFYFWTIITLIIILVFGTALIARIVAREMEILKIKSDFVSSVSHEFKTPLTSMKALTERLEKGKVTQPAKMKQYISIISYDIDRLIRLVGNILNFSNIEEGKKVYKKEKTDIAIWLKETINNYKKESFESDFNIYVLLKNDIPALYIDKEAMAQAIFNLLDNAVKFSRGDKEAEVTAEIKDNSIIIKIKDKGIGIENDEKYKIFEKFYRGESAVKYLIKGTGLGLALVRYTIEAHDGHIDVDKESGWSTVFIITL
ncbi:MAG: HAMP domain-containing sensor histidine kinase, partial [Bacteroidales bacterium]|nr:HAMP domain-containing sensor histidine kinase [Bacteroidales bacterium]